MRAIVLAAGLAALGGQANALSCMAPDAALAFQHYAAAEATYVVLLGRFDFVAPPYVEPQDINVPSTQSVVAQFEGQGLGETGFGLTAPRAVTLQTSCLGPWCGGFPSSDAEVLVFVEQTDAGYVLTLGPCGGEVFDPSVAPIVAACMRGERCEGALR